MFSFSNGDKHKVIVWYDVTPMDAFHILLGWPYQYDREIVYNEKHNICGLKIAYTPNLEEVPKKDPSLLSMKFLCQGEWRWELYTSNERGTQACSASKREKAFYDI